MCGRRCGSRAGRSCRTGRHVRARGPSWRRRAGVSRPPIRAGRPGGGRTAVEVGRLAESVGRRQAPDQRSADEHGNQAASTATPAASRGRAMSVHNQEPPRGMLSRSSDERGLCSTDLPPGIHYVIPPPRCQSKNLLFPTNSFTFFPDRERRIRGEDKIIAMPKIPPSAPSFSPLLQRPTSAPPPARPLSPERPAACPR